MNGGDYQELVTGPIEKTLSLLFSFATVWLWAGMGVTRGLRIIFFAQGIFLVMIWAPRFLSPYRSKQQSDEFIRLCGWIALALSFFAALGFRLAFRK